MRPEGSVIRGARKPGEAECCSKELAALVEHAVKLNGRCARRQPSEVLDRVRAPTSAAVNATAVQASGHNLLTAHASGGISAGRRRDARG